MALIKIPKSRFPVKVTPTLIAQINMMGIPLEQETKDEVEIEVLPNRPDALCATGFLRALRTCIGKDAGLKQYKIHPPEKNYTIKIDPKLKNIRPYTACAIVKGLKLDSEKIKEIIEIQEKLHLVVGRNRKKMAIGIYPLDKISLPIRFVARDPQEIRFVPLEFNKEMTGLEILQKHPKGKEYASLLEGLPQFPIFIDAAGQILSMPPIINSATTGKITPETTDVFIECSGFDFNIQHKTLIILSTALADMGGKIYSMKLDYGKKIITLNLKPEKMKISLTNINKLLGLNLTEKDLSQLLPRMGYDYSNKIVSIAPWRMDVLHEVDIAEDVAIAYGYDNLEPEIPKVSTIGEEAPLARFKSEIVEILIGLGLMEISTYHLIKTEEAMVSAIELLDSKTEYKLLRPNLRIPILRTLVSNRDNEYPQNLFEIGTVFNKGNTETGIKEEEHLCVALCHEKSDFTAIRQIVGALLSYLGKSFSIKETKHPEFIVGRVGNIYVDSIEVGIIGEIHPQILTDWGLEVPLTAFELNVEKLFEMVR